MLRRTRSHECATTFGSSAGGLRQKTVYVSGSTSPVAGLTEYGRMAASTRVAMACSSASSVWSLNRSVW